ncbi:MAG: hypothetical protein IJ501_01765 [Bacilli bacterium]|nr:hypothetical protein [Bacilli bacterium]
MTLFESLKLFPKVDLHIDYFGSIPKSCIYELTNEVEKVDDILEFESLKDYDNQKKLVSHLLNSLDNICFATKELITKLKSDNLIYGEIFINLDLFHRNLNKRDIIKTILNVIKKSDLELNIVLMIESNVSKESLYNDLDILYEYYKKGINGVYFIKNKQENLDSYKALFDKFIKDDIDYIVLLDSKLTNQNKEIYYNAKRIIYNLFEIPSDNFLNIIREEEIILEFPVTHQNYFNLYDDLSNHFVYDLFKENIKLCFTTIDMTILDTDMLNEYCKLFNVFPFNLHDLVTLNLNILNRLNIKDDKKNNLIDEFKEKANELF